MTVTEDIPQVCGHSRILHRLGLRACLKIVIPQSSVSHQTDPEKGNEEESMKLSDAEALRRR